jgi:N-acetylglutamate synthase-like GNAT family acetyltransferase
MAVAFDVRLATEQDIPALNALIPRSARALSAGSYTERQIESAITHVFGVDSQLIADGTYYVVTAEDGRIVGCGGWSKRATLFGGDQMKEEADDLLDPARDAARIRAFFVHPAWTRRGIGRRIIAECEAAARRAGFRRAELGATLPGEPLYAAMGYAVTERFDIPMPDGEVLPAAHMVKLFANRA